MKTITEELLMAYADGELDEATAREVRSAVDADPALAERVRQHRELRSRLQAAYRPALDEEVPERLLRSAQEAPATAPVIDLAARRAARQPNPPDATRQARPRSWAAWGGIAASVLVGVLIGNMFGIGGADEDEFLSTARGLLARGAIAEALTNRAAATPAPDGQIALQISFVDADNRYCRTFTTPALAGLACRDGDDWVVQTLLRSDGAAPTEMRQAGSALPPALLQIVDERMRGSALDREAEQAALQRRWQR